MKVIQVKKIDNALKIAINVVTENKEYYVRHPKTDFTRNRKISMEQTLVELLAMGGESLPKEMLKFGDINNTELTASAFIQQRAKILPLAFKNLFDKFNEQCNDKKTYRGYKLLAVDGSEIDCYRNPESPNHMKTKQSEKGFNKIHLNALYDLLNKTYVDVFLQPRPKADEQGALVKMLKCHKFAKKTIIIADRGYEGYNTLMHLYRTKNVDFMCRAKHGAGAYRCIARLPMTEFDKDVTFEVTTTQTNEDKKNNRIFLQTGSKKGKKNSSKTSITRWDFESPCRFRFRVVRFMLDTGEYETIITSLSRKEFPISEIKQLYHLRWGIETSFRELKYYVGLINLHSRKDDLIEQEIYAALTMYNYCCRIASALPINKTKKVKYDYVINYSMAISICKHFFRRQESNISKIIRKIIKYTVPIRPGRQDERNIKNKGFVGFTYRVAA